MENIHFIDVGSMIHYVRKVLDISSPYRIMYATKMHLLPGTCICRLPRGLGGACTGHTRHGLVLRPHTWTRGRSETQSPAAAAVFTCSHARASAAAATGLPFAGAGPTILPFLPRVPEVGIFFTFSLPEATEAATGVFVDAHPGGVTGFVALVITYASPRTTGAVAAIDVCSFPRAAAVVNASVPGVAGSGPSGFRDAHPGAFADSTPRVAGKLASDFTEARVAAALAAVAPHSHAWAALPAAIMPPGALLA